MIQRAALQIIQAFSYFDLSVKDERCLAAAAQHDFEFKRDVQSNKDFKHQLQVTATCPSGVDTFAQDSSFASFVSRCTQGPAAAEQARSCSGGRPRIAADRRCGTSLSMRCFINAAVQLMVLVSCWAIAAQGASKQLQSVLHGRRLSFEFN